jgi:biopolymer transport protein ExbD
MPKVKVHRKPSTIDMTAMCDVGFLLLTFFILTSKFKPQEPVALDIPASTAQIPIPDRYIISMLVDKEGKVFVGVDDQVTRLEWLNQIAQEYNIQISDKGKEAFRLIDAFGCKVEELPQMLALEGAPRDKMQKGVQIDSVNGRSQLEDLIFLARRAGQMVQPEPFRIVIRADKDADYRVVARVIKVLQDRKNNVNKFNLITSAKGGAAAPAKEGSH